MKKKISILVAAICLTFSVNINAQTLYVPGGTEGIVNNTTNSFVGIGTIPSAKLHLYEGNGSGTNYLRMEGVGEWATIGLHFLSPSTNMELTTYRDMMSITGGNLGIGTTEPQTKLHLYEGSGSGTNYIKMEGVGPDATIGIQFVSPSTNMGLTTYKGMMGITGGNVGIGETAPSSKLTIQSSGEGSSLSIQSTYAGYKKIFEITQESSDGFLYLRNAHGETVTKLSGYSSTSSYFMSNVGIGTSNPQNALDVNGTIHAREVKVNLEGWSDFVFHPTYKLKPLAEVEKYIKANGHLEAIPSAKEVEQNGVNVGQMQAKLLQKVEELTLYMIELKKENEQIKNELKAIKNDPK